MFDSSFKKLASVRLDEIMSKLTTHYMDVMYRVKDKAFREVNPLLETYDLLHMQEMSLRAKLLGIDGVKKPKNRRAIYKNKVRGGGHSNI